MLQKSICGPKLNQRLYDIVRLRLKCGLATPVAWAAARVQMVCNSRNDSLYVMALFLGQDEIDAVRAWTSASGWVGHRVGHRTSHFRSHQTNSLEDSSYKTKKASETEAFLFKPARSLGSLARAGQILQCHGVRRCRTATPFGNGFTAVGSADQQGCTRANAKIRTHHDGVRGT